MGKPTKDNGTAKTGQFHLRVTQDAYDKIKERAASFNMSVSDYVVFTTMHFDIVNITEKIDKINEKLDGIYENGKTRD